MPRAHPQNAAGPFYVEHDCCLTCSVPFDAAPGHFSYTDAGDHCFVSRQPESAEEEHRMLVAAANSGEACIRYRGAAPDVIRALADAGDAELWDAPLPSGDPRVGVLDLGAPLPTGGSAFARKLAYRCCAVQWSLRVRAEDGPPHPAPTTLERWGVTGWTPAFTLDADEVDGVGRLHVELDQATLADAAAIVLAALLDHGGFPEARWRDL